MKKGFTLIEVLIVVIILGILATLAIPQFARMTRRARLAEAWAGLGGVRTAEAVYFMEWNAYTATMDDLDFDTPSGSIFTYTLQGASATNFTAQATGTGTGAGITAWIWVTGNSYNI